MPSLLSFLHSVHLSEDLFLGRERIGIYGTLELLQCLEAGQSELRKGYLVSVDVSKIDYITCEMTDGRHVKFAWKEMGRGTEKGRQWLIAQLDGYVSTIQDPRSRNCKEFDFTVPGHGYGR